MNDVNYVVLGRRIRILRKYRRMTQEQLAEAAGLSIQHLSNAENARTKLAHAKIKTSPTRCMSLWMNWPATEWIKSKSGLK